MPSIADRVRPFLNQYCKLTVSPSTKQLLKALQIPTRGGGLSLYIFDWDKQNAELKGIVCEQAGQDDYPVFAIINPEPGGEDLREMIDDDNNGFLMLGDDDTIYVGDGEMEQLTSNIDEFFKNLKVSEDEDAEDEDESSDEESDEEEESDDEESDDEDEASDGEEDSDGEPLSLKITKETDWNNISKEEHWEKTKQMAQTMNWRAYDWESSPAADMSFPDFTPEEMAKKAPWLPRHYNSTSEMSTRHVPDLNQMGDGAERKMFATYGVPVDWPSKDKAPQELNEMLDLMDAARAKGGDEWAEAMDTHGVVNDEHYLWLRVWKLGYSKKLEGNSDKIDAILKEIDAAVASGNPSSKFAEYELRDAEHYKAFQLHYAAIKTKAWAKQNAKADEVYAKQDAQAAEDKKAVETQGFLSPVQGVSLEDWARSNAKIIQGTTVDAIIEGLKIGKDAWDAANKEWNARMASDKTFTVVTVYGAAFMGDAALAAAVAKARGK